jgi:hypothetical protein
LLTQLFKLISIIKSCLLKTNSLSDSTTDIFRKWDEFITAAKAAKLIDIFKTDNKSRLSYLKTAVIKQTLIQEGNLTIQIMQEIEANELYAYFYATDIIAVNSNFPTEESGSRMGCISL